MANQQKQLLAAAFFDVDGTLVNANVVNHYLYLATKDTVGIYRWMTFMWIAFQVPFYLLIDRLSRSLFNRVFYRNYRGMSVAKSLELSQQYFERKLRDRIFPSARDCLIEHQEQGDLVILVTGSLDFITAPLAEFLGVNTAIATHLKTEKGKYTGEIAGVPLAGKEKLQEISNFAEDFGIDLSIIYAYGDSMADLSMLNAVGYPVVVNPNKNLKKIAQEKGWIIQKWHENSNNQGDILKY